jgi:hypothetical protein
MKKHQFDMATQERIKHLMKRQKRTIGMKWVMISFLITIFSVPTYMILAMAAFGNKAPLPFTIVFLSFIGLSMIFSTIIFIKSERPLAYNNKIKSANLDTTAQGIIVKRYFLMGGKSRGHQSNAYKYLVMVPHVDNFLSFTVRIAARTTRNPAGTKKYKISEEINVMYDSKNPDVCKVV